MASGGVQYANWWSKVFFKESFDKQFTLPIPPPRVFSILLKGAEKVLSPSNLDLIPIDRPIFIVGLPRSGTSMLYELLCAHERAAYVTNSINSAPETILAIEWLRKKLKLNIKGERFLADSIDTDFGSPSEPAMFWGKWIGRDVDSLYWPEKKLTDFTPEKIREIHDDVRKMILSFGGIQKRFICKYPVFQTELRMINALFPDAFFVHIIRDGRMVANSLVKLHRLMNDQIKKIKHPTVKYLVPYPRVKSLEDHIRRFGADDIRCTAHVWQDSIEAVRAVSRDLSHFVEIRYEDILKNSEQEILGLMDRLELQRPETGNTEFWERVKKVGVIHHKNQYGHFDVVEQIAGQTLRDLGYV